METNCVKLQVCDLHTDHPLCCDTRNLRYITVYNLTQHSKCTVYHCLQPHTTLTMYSIPLFTISHNTHNVQYTTVYNLTQHSQCTVYHCLQPHNTHNVQYTTVYNLTQHTPWRSFIIWQVVSHVLV